MTQIVKFLYEEALEPELIVEAKSDKVNKRIYLDGIFLQSNIVNGNGRVYEKSWFKKHVDKYINEKINNINSYGELTHPDYFEVNIKTATHRITELTEDGDNWRGRLVLLDDPLNPDISKIKAVINEGTKLGVSSRAVGRVITTRGVHHVQEDGFSMSTAADIVLNPSAPGAYVNAIMEKKEFIWGEGGSLVEAKYSEVERLINKEYRHGDVIGKALVELVEKITQSVRS